MMYLAFLFLFCLVCIQAQNGSIDLKPLVDTNEHCNFWATNGECTANPAYMLISCAKSCQEVEKLINKGSFYDIREPDIHGNILSMDRFKGKVVYIVNVASQCGYTKENYALLKGLKKYIPLGLDIVLAPCNSFGNQEPGTPKEIYSFIDKQEYDGYILSKDEVNGGKTRPLFKFLKSVTGKNEIQWNFDGKFLVGRNGQIYTTSTKDVEKKIVELLAEDYNSEL